MMDRSIGSEASLVDEEEAEADEAAAGLCPFAAVTWGRGTAGVGRLIFFCRGQLTGGVLLAPVIFGAQAIRPQRSRTDEAIGRVSIQS